MLKRLLFALLLLCLSPSLTFGQFGRNKIQYVNFEWSVINTPHFEIYYYPEETFVANIGADFAEASFEFLKDKFKYEPTKKISLVIYNSPNHFQQTNVIPQILPEGVAGFTEYMKGRVALPFNGSIGDFQRVIQHELVHVFLMRLQLHLCKTNKKSFSNTASPPLWFNEGLAEYWSEGWSTQVDAILREMVITGQVVTFRDLPRIRGSFLMYKVGQSIVRFMLETYGEEKFNEVLHGWASTRNFEKLVKEVYGRSLYDIGDEWLSWIRKMYIFDYKIKQLPSEFAKRVTWKGINVEPVVVDETSIVYKHISRGYTELKINEETIIRGERNVKFESLHIFDSQLDVFGDLLVFSVKSGKTDQLCIYQISKRKIIFKKGFSGVVLIKSPSFVGTRGVVFSGTCENGFSNLYFTDLTLENLWQLTNDVYSVNDPTGSTHDYVAFSSNRASSWESNNIFLYSLATGKVFQVTYGDFSDAFPTWGNAGNNLVFTSNRSGTQDLYYIPDIFADTIKIQQITNSVSDIRHPSFTTNDSSIVFTGYEKFSYQIFKCNLFDTTITSLQAVITPEANLWKYHGVVRKSEKYKKKYSLDIAQSNFAYDTYYGSVGGFQFALSDMLGDSYFYFLVYNNSSNINRFFDGLNFAVVYYDRKSRLNTGIGVFRFSNYRYNAIYGPMKSQDYGLFGSVEYPFSQFKRIEFTTQLRQTQKTTFVGYNPRAFVHDIGAAYVKDNTIWTVTGPVEGQRFRLSAVFSWDINNFEKWKITYKIDFRNYFRLGRRSTFATRLVGFQSTGIDPDRVYMGGSWSLRGYPLRCFYGKNAILASNELRFPLLDNIAFNIWKLRFGFPQIETAVFFDIGKAWERGRDPMYGSYGFGFRVPFGGIGIFRFDFSKRLILISSSVTIFK